MQPNTQSFVRHLDIRAHLASTHFLFHFLRTNSAVAVKRNEFFATPLKKKKKKAAKIDQIQHAVILPEKVTMFPEQFASDKITNSQQGKMLYYQNRLAKLPKNVLILPEKCEKVTIKS